MRKNPQFYKYAAIVLSVVFVVSAGFFFLKLWEDGRDQIPTVPTEDPTLEYQGKEYERKENVETFLVMGLDKFEDTATGDSYNNNQQADFLLLFVLDNEAKTYATISINRDTMASMDVLGVVGNRIDTITQQIALAHAYGNGREISCRNTATAVSRLLLDMKVNHYMSLTMDAVPIFNDMLGGVEVEVLDDFTGIDDTLVKGQIVKLMGQQALTYVRSRYGMDDSSNAHRMLRQRQYLEALQALTLERVEQDENFVVDATLQLSEYMVSDRSVTQLQKLFDKVVTYTYLGSPEIQGESKPGERFLEFHPDPASIQQLVVELFYQEKN